MMNRIFYVIADETGVIEGWGMCEAAVREEQFAAMQPRQCVEITAQEYAAMSQRPKSYQVKDGGLVNA